MRYVLLAILAWFIYSFVFKLVIPVYRTTRQMKKKFREMQEEQLRQQQEHEQQQQFQKPGYRPSKEDYLDFEEVK